MNARTLLLRAAGRSMRRAAAIGIAIAALSGADARAEIVRAELFGSLVTAHDSDFNSAVDTGPFSAWGAGLSFPIALGIGIDTAYHYLSAEGTRQGFGLDFAAHTLTAGARYQYAALDWLDVYGRLGAVMSRGSVDVALDANSALSANAWAFGASASAGVELHFPTESFWGDDPESLAKDFTFGVFFELGYQWLTDYDFGSPAVSLEESDFGDAARTTSALGGFSLSSAFARAGLMVRL
jgi:hypothetical protein